MAPRVSASFAVEMRTVRTFSHTYLLSAGLLCLLLFLRELLGGFRDGEDWRLLLLLLITAHSHDTHTEPLTSLMPERFVLSFAERYIPQHAERSFRQRKTFAFVPHLGRETSHSCLQMQAAHLAPPLSTPFYQRLDFQLAQVESRSTVHTRVRIRFRMRHAQLGPDQVYVRIDAPQIKSHSQNCSRTCAMVSISPTHRTGAHTHAHGTRVVTTEPHVAENKALVGRVWPFPSGAAS